MTPIHLIGSAYCLPIPEGATGFELDNPLSVGDLVYYLGFPSVFNFRKISLPPGNWEIIRTTKECTEEQAKEMVKELPVGQRWHNYNGDPPVWWHSAKESLRSLLISKGLDVNKNYVLIKKVA